MATLEEILAIPENRRVYERLTTLLDKRSAIAFVGAGASAPLYPTWGQLIEDLIQLAESHGASKEETAYWRKSADKKALQTASQIRNHVGDPVYHPFLFETFKDKKGDDGKPYSATHALLMRMNFQAYVTTNYDPGLTQARRFVRPEIIDTGYTIWTQNENFYRWRDAECPILFAHGHYADGKSIVLDQASYQQAYRPETAYRRLFDNLWLQENLVFVGFSFGDPALEFLAGQVISQIVKPSGGPPRHIAILPLNEPYTPVMREEFRDTYHAEALFFPISGGDYSGLQALLESLAYLPAPEPPKWAAVPTPAPRVRELFVHETTEDEKFTGREDELGRLDRWARDPQVRIVAITAFGGFGKTALLAKWLKGGRAVAARTADGIFFWSFYRERDARKCFAALAEFAAGRANVVVALDGLEVIQEAPGTVAYGKLLDLDLAKFLHDHCRARDGHLVVLTSRFPFEDLTPYLGRGVRSLALPALEPADGAKLLRSLGLDGADEDLEKISRDLDGHPLALRILARSVPPEFRGDPTRLWNLAAELGGSDPLETKMQRLLEFYERYLPEAHRRALGLIALFRAPVGEETLARLWKGKGSLPDALSELHREHLITADPEQDGKLLYACHPILRNHFRAQVLGRSDLAKEAASLIAGSPDLGHVSTVEQAQTISAAIEVLLDAGDVKAAHDLYVARLVPGVSFSAFRDLPAPHLGVEVARSFVRDKARQELVAEVLGLARLSSYLNEVGLYADLAGEPETARVFHATAAVVRREHHLDRNLSVGLRNLGSTEVSLGNLSEAGSHFKESHELTRKTAFEEGEVFALTWIAYADSLRGEISSAGDHFSAANIIINRIQPDHADLHGLDGIQWAEHLLRTGAIERARKLTEANVKICQRNGWRNDLALCARSLGWLATLEGHWAEAHQHLDVAKSIFDRGHMIRDLAPTLVTESECHLGEGNFEAALVACERALQLAAPRGYRLIHSDALNVRARIRLAQPSPDAALARDDAEAALDIAERCEYAWAQRDACQTLGRAWGEIGDESKAVRYRQRAEEWTRRLKPTPAR